MENFFVLDFIYCGVPNRLNSSICEFIWVPTKLFLLPFLPNDEKGRSFRLPETRHVFLDILLVLKIF